MNNFERKKLEQLHEKTGGPAFPVPLDDFRDSASHPMTGMTLRDWYEGKAITGLLSGWDGSSDIDFDALAIGAEKMAAAMIRRRARR